MTRKHKRLISFRKVNQSADRYEAVIAVLQVVAQLAQLPQDPDAAQEKLLRLAVLIHVVVQGGEEYQRLCNLQKDDEDSE